ncbi:related to O-methylsterigmatocystin oxidoreductase [Fusarium torulosum]|uniref:Related to O-methylsterigmatocystin oxidoreductase n=1 Tax=Fusarium torulosum TaxID=33205 RepID=A0AAE8M5H4_9HYPO|nr:related to O-methylsterigmatocystin oxidoreductase [Fusarium torulosum]
MGLLLVPAVALAVLILYYVLIPSKKRSGLPLPPGPKPLPLVGNIFDLPPAGTAEYKHWAKHNELYGPISHLNVLGTPLIVLNDRDAMHDLLEKKSTKTSSRPWSPFASELCGFGVMLPVIPYGDKFRYFRKLVHQQMGTKLICSEFRDTQDLESLRFLIRTIERPEDFQKHIKTEASAIILRIIYGYNIEPHKVDPLVSLIETMMTNFSYAFVPLSWAVDIIPSLNKLPDWFPGTSYKQTAKKWRQTTDEALNIPYNFVMDQMNSGTNRPSYVSSLMSKSFKNEDDTGKPTKEDIEAVKATATIMYGGGADTTVSTISSFVLAMISFPEVQKKAQEEIDRVTGGERLPTFEDQENMPYLNALAKEALRWMPVVPTTTTHVTEEEIEYKGYCIPKGTYLIPSTWWLLHDPEVYPNPDAFEPERYIAPRNEPDPSDYAFGYGRRICPGRYLAEDSIFMTLARLLAVFNMRKAVDDKGNEIDVVIDGTPGLISHPVEYAYSITPRSDKHVEMVRSAERAHPWEESDASLLKKDSPV